MRVSVQPMGAENTMTGPQPSFSRISFIRLTIFRIPLPSTSRSLPNWARSSRSRISLPNVVCTPHLGAATTEAQENVALQVAEQMSDYLLNGAVQRTIYGMRREVEAKINRLPLSHFDKMATGSFAIRIVLK